MAIKASGQITIVDLSDARQLSAYIASNLPKVQMYDPNTNIYVPAWNTTNLILTPSVFLNQTPFTLTENGLTITWKRKDGAGAEVALTTGEVVTGGVLKVSANKLSEATSGLLTYTCYLTYADPETSMTVNISADISFSLVKNAINAHLASIEGEQVFKYDKNSVLQNSQISLSGNVQGILITKWQYKNSSGVYVDYPTTADNANITGSTLIVKPAHTVFTNNVANIKLVTNDTDVSDTITIYKIYDGATGSVGAGGITVFLSNEAQVIPCTVGSLATGAISIVTQVRAYQGTTEILPVVTTPTGLPSGMTFAQATVGNYVNCTFSIASGANLGGTTAVYNNGIVNLAIVAGGASVTKVFSWSKSITGATGATGTSSVNFSIYAPNGTVVSNGTGTISLLTSAHKGITEITSGATYVWSKNTSGSWAVISGATTSSLSVAGSDITNIASYKCVMTYETKAYTDVITLEDKTDSLVATVIALGGTVFKNSLGSTALVCKIFSNGEEIDALKSNNIGTTAPASPVNGTFWYEVNATTRVVTLKKYSGTAWAVASGVDLHTNTYNWYRNDSNGNNLDAGAIFATGKVIYINDTNVNGSTNFVVEIV